MLCLFMNSLIGSTGFVGSNLARQARFDFQCHSRNIETMAGRSFDLVVCAGVQAKKWWANEHPDEDWSGIARLQDVLRTTRAERFVLISTVDVYPDPVGVTEQTPVTEPRHAYGRHRLAFENFVRHTFPHASIVRLPGLFGIGLKKNVIFDLLHDNCLEQINPEASYQYYSLARLWDDLGKVLALRLPLINFGTEPIQTAELIDRFFPEQRSRVGPGRPTPIQYDMRTTYAREWASPVPEYLIDRATVLQEIGAFIQQERA